jgi:hypothetical protein
MSADVGYKWLARWGRGDDELADRSRRPRSSLRPATAMPKRGCLPRLSSLNSARAVWHGYF